MLFRSICVPVGVPVSPVVVVLPESGPGICVGGTSVGMGVSVSPVIVVVIVIEGPVRSGF